MSSDADAVRQWWRTSIIDMKPGQIAFRGHPIQELIGNVTFRSNDLADDKGRVADG